MHLTWRQPRETDTLSIFTEIKIATIAYELIIMITFSFTCYYGVILEKRGSATDHNYFLIKFTELFATNVYRQDILHSHARWMDA